MKIPIMDIARQIGLLFIRSTTKKDWRRLRVWWSMIPKPFFMDISHGPTFGGGFDIHIANNAGHNVHSYTNFGHSFLAPSDVEEKDTVLAGTYYFTPDEVEVFYLP